MHRTTCRVGFAALAFAAATVIGASPVAARDGDVIRTGDCSGRSDWKLKLGPRDGGIETEFEVDSNVVGQVWNVRLLQNGSVVARGQATTDAPSGSFEFRRRLPNLAGIDTVVGVATNPATGETCRGRASL
jgi:hypothetical protein